MLSRITVLWHRAALSLVGVSICIVSVAFLIRLWQGKMTFDLFTNILLTISLVFILSIGSTLFLFVFPDKPIIRRISQFTLFPAQLIDRSGYYYNVLITPIYAFLFTLTMPFIVWVIVLYIWQDLQILSSVVFYTVFTVFLVLFVYLGRFMSVGLLKFQLIGRQEDYPAVAYRLLQREKLRLLAYIVLAVLYVWFNIENFAGLVFIQWSIWLIYREVILEVLLTFSILDYILERIAPDRL